jgi:TolB-like protein
VTGSTGREQIDCRSAIRKSQQRTRPRDFADGIQEEILTRLTKIGTKKVISRTSTQQYKGAAAAS